MCGQSPLPDGLTQPFTPPSRSYSCRAPCLTEGDCGSEGQGLAKTTIRQRRNHNFSSASLIPEGAHLATNLSCPSTKSVQIWE